MGYATRQDMIDRFGEAELVQATNLEEENTFQIVDRVLNAALAYADSLIDSYLRAKYVLPLASVPAVLIDTACDLARFRLWVQKPSEAVSERNSQALSFLKSVASGAAALVVAAPAESPAPQGGPVVQAGDRVFTPDTLDDY